MTIQKTHSLKSLQTARRDLVARQVKYKEEKEIASKLLQGVNKDIADVDKEINKIRSKRNPVVTEHAMLRYFERVLGYDLAAIRKQILAGGDFKTKMVDGSITTIITSDTGREKRARKLKRVYDEVSNEVPEYHLPPHKRSSYDHPA